MACGSPCKSELDLEIAALRVRGRDASLAHLEVELSRTWTAVCGLLGAGDNALGHFRSASRAVALMHSGDVEACVLYLQDKRSRVQKFAALMDSTRSAIDAVLECFDDCLYPVHSGGAFD